MRYHRQPLKLSSLSSMQAVPTWPCLFCHKHWEKLPQCKFFLPEGFPRQELACARPTIGYPVPCRKRSSKPDTFSLAMHYRHNRFHRKLWFAVLENERCRCYPDHMAMQLPPPPLSRDSQPSAGKAQKSLFPRVNREPAFLHAS